ncbi:MAG: DUF2252 domain-containing protein [Gaiellales bacterium]
MSETTEAADTPELPQAVADPDRRRSGTRWSASGRVPHLTPEERVARGRAARQEAPRGSHAGWEPPAHRPDPIELLESQALTRVPELVPIRYGRMLTSPLAFYRGGALIMASDLAGTPRSGLRAQICGDAHLSNFGVFGSPERRLVFDINDFDETLPGPWEWDVKRLAASLEIAGRERGFTSAQRRAIVLDTTRGYRVAMARFAAMRNLDVWYESLDMEALIRDVRDQLDRKAIRRTEANIARSRTRDSMQAFSKLVREVDGEPRITGDPPLIVPVEDVSGQVDRELLEETIRDLIRSYRRTLEPNRRRLLEQFRYVHMARKVVGVGSVGTRAWIVLLLGRDDNDPLFLQAKEAQASVLEEFVGRSEYRKAGQRVVQGQRLMQAASDIFLGWQRVIGLDGLERDFYLRQLRDWKGRSTWTRPSRGGGGRGDACSAERVQAGICMMVYGAAWTAAARWTLGPGARALGRPDRVAIASTSARVTCSTARSTSSPGPTPTNQRDYEALVAAVASGRVTAQAGL